MRVDINVNIYTRDEETPSWALELKHMLGLVIMKENRIMSAQTDALDQAEAAAAANSAADDSAEALLVTLSGMVAGLVDNQTDPATTARIQALAAAIDTRSKQLATAVVANTPAATTP